MERLELPEAISGPQLERALALLVDRLLARQGAAGGACGACGSARGWPGAGAGARGGAAQRQRRSGAPAPGAAPKLDELPGPATSLSLRALETGPPANDQAALDEIPARAAGGGGSPRRFARRGRSPERDAVLRVLEVDSRSRLPERRSS